MLRASPQGPLTGGHDKVVPVRWPTNALEASVMVSAILLEHWSPYYAMKPLYSLEAGQVKQTGRKKARASGVRHPLLRLPERLAEEVVHAQHARSDILALQVAGNRCSDEGSMRTPSV